MPIRRVKERVSIPEARKRLVAWRDAAAGRAGAAWNPSALAEIIWPGTKFSGQGAARSAVPILKRVGATCGTNGYGLAGIENEFECCWCRSEQKATPDMWRLPVEELGGYCAKSGDPICAGCAEFASSNGFRSRFKTDEDLSDEATAKKANRQRKKARGPF